MSEMSEADAGGSAGDGAEQTDERIDHERREALMRLAKYTAPAVLAVLLSAEKGSALVCVSPCVEFRHSLEARHRPGGRTR